MDSVAAFLPLFVCAASRIVCLGAVVLSRAVGVPPFGVSAGFSIGTLRPPWEGDYGQLNTIFLSRGYFLDLRSGMPFGACLVFVPVAQVGNFASLWWLWLCRPW